MAGEGKYVRAPLVVRRLARFHPNYRVRVAALAARHSRLADLAASFPALLFALAVPRFGIDPDTVIRGVIEGRSLNDVAAQARLPMWLRKLPPEAFQAPIPPLPDGDILRRQIVNHLPRSPKRMQVWLDAVSTASEFGSQPIAVWIAREVTALEKAPTALDLRRLRLVVLWAWFSGQPGTLGRRLIGTPWSPSMKFKTGHEAARAWRELVELHLVLGEHAIVDAWFEPAVIEGYEFVPLTTARDIATEAERMENCLASYGGLISSCQSRIWSVRHAGETVAVIEVGRRKFMRRDTFVGVQQIRGLRNAPVADEVRAVVAKWQMQQDLLLDPRGPIATEAELQQAWIAMWRPYWRARSRIPSWLPLARRLDCLW